MDQDRCDRSFLEWGRDDPFALEDVPEPGSNESGKADTQPQRFSNRASLRSFVIWVTTTHGLMSNVAILDSLRVK